MKMTTLKSVAIAVGLASTAFGQATSPVVGYRTQTLEVGFNLVGVNLHNSTLVEGVISEEAGAVLGDEDVDYTAILNDPEAVYIFEVLDGPQEGATSFVASVADGSVTLEGSVGAGVGAAYSIRRAPALNDVFGELTPGFTAATADVVYIPDGPGVFNQFFRNSTTGNFRPVGSFQDPAIPISLLYSDGVLVEKKGSPLDLVLTGEVKEEGTIVDAALGFNVVAVSGPAGSTLANSDLAQGLTPGFTAATADVVYVQTAPGEFRQFFVSSISDNFREAGSFEDAPEIPVDSALLIERKGESTAVLFDTPENFSSF